MTNSAFSISNNTNGTPVRIGGGSVSDVSSFQVSSFASDLYKNYFIQILSMVPATDGAQLYLRTSSDSGSTYDSGASDYQYNEKRCTIVSLSPVLSNNQSASADHIQISAPVGNASNESLSGQLTISSPSNSALYTQVAYRCACLTTTGRVTISSGSGARSEAGIIDAFELYFSSGNIASGELVMYGEKIT